MSQLLRQVCWSQLPLPWWNMSQHPQQSLHPCRQSHHIGFLLWCSSMQRLMILLFQLYQLRRKMFGYRPSAQDAMQLYACHKLVLSSWLLLLNFMLLVSMYLSCGGCRRCCCSCCSFDYYNVGCIILVYLFSSMRSQLSVSLGSSMLSSFRRRIKDASATNLRYLSASLFCRHPCKSMQSMQTKTSHVLRVLTVVR